MCDGIVAGRAEALIVEMDRTRAEMDALDDQVKSHQPH